MSSPNAANKVTSRCDFKLSYVLNFSRYSRYFPLQLEQPNYPSFMTDLLANNRDPYTKNFRAHIRSYNSALSFASMGANIVTPTGSGPYCFKTHGQVYHSTSHLHPRNGIAPKYAQLYVLDSALATQHRLALAPNQDCLPEIMVKIDAFFRANNMYAKSYRMMHEIERDQIDKAQREGTPIPNISMVFNRDLRSSDKRYDLPTPSANEIAMVFTTDDGQPPFERDFQVYSRRPIDHNKNLISLHTNSPHLNPMVYALMFPYGDSGWQENIPGFLDSNRHITKLEFTAYQTQVRDFFNPVMRSGKLTQQWLVDSYLQVEANNLNYIKRNQTDFRV